MYEWKQEPESETAEGAVRLAEGEGPLSPSQSEGSLWRLEVGSP